MVTDDDVARAIAFFNACDDVALLQDVLRGIQPRASAEVRRQLARNREAPPPREIAPSAALASQEEAVKTVREATDFGQLQALARAAGRRVESLNAS
jgi:hypothetical protein